MIECFSEASGRSQLKTYHGHRDPQGITVTVDDVALDPRYDLRQLSQSGFEWGYTGAGPMQLALAILADHFGDGGQALKEYRRYCELVIAEIEDDEWSIESSTINASLVEVTDVPMTLEQLLSKVRGDG